MLGVTCLTVEDRLERSPGAVAAGSRRIAQGGRHPTDRTLAAWMPKGSEASVLGRRLARGRRH
jgi:hypothetical protein